MYNEELALLCNQTISQKVNIALTMTLPNLCLRWTSSKYIGRSEAENSFCFDCDLTQEIDNLYNDVWPSRKLIFNKSGFTLHYPNHHSADGRSRTSFSFKIKKFFSSRWRDKKPYLCWPWRALIISLQKDFKWALTERAKAIKFNIYDGSRAFSLFLLVYFVLF